MLKRIFIKIEPTLRKYGIFKVKTELKYLGKNNGWDEYTAVKATIKLFGVTIRTITNE